MAYIHATTEVYTFTARIGPGRSRKVALTVAVAALPAIAVSALTTSVGASQSHGAVPDHGAESLAAFLHDHPKLNTRAMPLAFIKEKINGGEASQHAVNGPRAGAVRQPRPAADGFAPSQEAGAQATLAQALVRGASP